MQLQNDINVRHLSLSSASNGTCNVSNQRRAASRVAVDELHDEIIEDSCFLKRYGYNIRIASPLGLNARGALIKRMYSWRGYHTEGTTASSRNQTTLEAFKGTNLVGTLTLALDSKDRLLADELYGRELNAFRVKNRKLCELSKLAIDPEYSSKELLASLFNVAYIYGRTIHCASDFVIEVNPRHSGYYKRVLGFEEIGETRICPRVNAPAVLLHLELQYVDAQVSLLAGSREPRERSLYPYFLPKHEEKKVANRACRSLDRLAEQQCYRGRGLDAQLHLAAFCG